MGRKTNPQDFSSNPETPVNKESKFGVLKQALEKVLQQKDKHEQYPSVDQDPSDSD